MLQDILSSWGALPVSPMDVYTDVFKLGDGYIQTSDEEAGGYKSNPIAYYRNKGSKTGHFRIMFEDTFEETLKEVQKASDFAILNGITYFGRRNLQERASKMFAMIFDLDGVTDTTLNAFLSGAYNAKVYPIPNYIALSGHGAHLYYLFEEPIDLYPYIKLQLKELKYALTDKIWNPYTSTEEKVQHQGINQGFRVLGSKTKENAESRIVRAYRLNTHPFSLEQLCEFVSEEHRVDKKQIYKETKYTLDQAKEKFPEWYHEVIVKGHKKPKYWDIAGKVNGDNPYALYDWWKRQIKAGATYHHRYFAIMCLAIYGAKCRKPYDDVEADALELVPFLNAINPDEPFTEEDCTTALECYDLRYSTFPIKDIEKLSGIEIPPNDRNHRSRHDHLHAEYWIDKKTGRPKANTCKQNRELALKFMRENGEIKGRPQGSGTAEQKVKEWRQNNPLGTKAQCCRALNLSKPTVYKWWD